MHSPVEGSVTRQTAVAELRNQWPPTPPQASTPPQSDHHSFSPTAPYHKNCSLHLPRPHITIFAPRGPTSQKTAFLTAPHHKKLLVLRLQHYKKLLPLWFQHHKNLLLPQPPNHKQLLPPQIQDHKKLFPHNHHITKNCFPSSVAYTPK